MKARHVYNLSLIGILLAGAASARQVDLDVSLANPVLLAQKKQTTYLKIGMTGFEMSGDEERVPVNVALVLDKSGSMSGEKIRHAKKAALMALQRLNRNDIVSVIAYDSTVRVLVPATKASDSRAIRKGIEKLSAGGSTALFAGVSKGAAELRKFLSDNRVNRIILLSDGLANVGPETPGELGSLGAALSEEGITVTTIGLGLNYNEDLMTRLAKRSDGNHAFVENPRELAKIFDREFGDVLSVVAQEVEVRIRCAPGVRPVRVMGRDADISGRTVVTSLNQLYSSQEKYIMLEVEVPEGEAGENREVAEVRVAYANMETRTQDDLSSAVSVRFTEAEKVVEKSVEKDVMVDAVMQVAAERNKLAVELRDAGKQEESRQLLLSNGKFLRRHGGRYNSKKLNDYAAGNEEQAEMLDEASWRATRKQMRYEQNAIDLQQAW